MILPPPIPPNNQEAQDPLSQSALTMSDPTWSSSRFIGDISWYILNLQQPFIF